MELQQTQAQELARLIHHYRNALATEHATEWAEISEEERHLLVSAVQLAIREVEINQSDADRWKRRHFPRPGQAEWGC